MMKSLPDPRTLEDWSLLVGAGVSLFGRTSLPDGVQLLESAIRLTVSSDLLDGLVTDAVQHPSFHLLVPETLLQRFRDIRDADMPDHFYAPFREARPNGLHGWVAAAADAGCAVLTTNFDVCLERAGASSVHLHGRADQPTTLVHTIVRVGKGIDAPLAAAAKTLTENRPLLVVGYSGNDDDVLALIAELEPACIHWVVRDLTDRAVANHARWAENLPLTTFLESDLKLQEGLLPRPQESWKPVGIERPETAPPPSELTQLEMVLAIALELQDYALAERILKVEPTLQGTVNERCSLLTLACYVERQRGRYDEALSFASRAETLGPSLDLLQARLATEIGLTHLDQEPPALELAERDLVKAYRISRNRAGEEAHDRFQASALHNLGWLAERRGRSSRALGRYRAALAMRLKLGDLTHELFTARDVAILMLVLRKPRAQECLNRFKYLNEKFGSSYETADFHFLLGQAHLRVGNRQAARLGLEAAQQQFTHIRELDRAEHAGRVLSASYD